MYYRLADFYTIRLPLYNFYFSPITLRLIQSKPYLQFTNIIGQNLDVHNYSVYVAIIACIET